MDIAVFCGASLGRDDAYAGSARELGAAIGARGHGLVYGGGSTGLMGVVADAALAAGARVVGVIPEALAAREVAHRGLTELLIVGSMHERKAAMAERAGAFVALPGGFGTLEEFLEVVTWAQLGIHAKPCVLLDVRGFFAPLRAMFDQATECGFIAAATRGIVRAASTPDEALDLAGAA